MTARVLVLIADDDPDVRLISRANFEFVGFEVIEASSGMEALYSVRNDGPDVVILDLSMPDVDGAEVLEVMRREGIDIPVVILSGYDLSSPLAKRAMNFSPSAFLVKPFSPTELLNTTLAAMGVSLDYRQIRRVGIIEALSERNQDEE